MLAPHARTLVPWTIECKNTERLNVWEAFDQAASHGGDMPVVVIKKNGRAPLCAMPWADALALLQRACSAKPAVPVEPPTEPPEHAYPDPPEQAVVWMRHLLTVADQRADQRACHGSTHG